jgi:hypothetical protein
MLATRRKEIASIENLQAQLHKMLDEEGLDNIGMLAARIEEKKSELQNWIAKGKQESKPAKRLEQDLEGLYAIIAINDQIKSLSETDQLQHLDEEFANRLAAEDLQDVVDLSARIKTKSEELEKLKANGKITSRPAQNLVIELRELQEIQALYEKISSLGNKAQSIDKDIPEKPIPMLADPTASMPVDLTSSSFVSTSPILNVSSVTQNIQPSASSSSGSRHLPSPSESKTEIFYEIPPDAIGKIPECAEKSLVQLYVYFQRRAKKNNDTLLTDNEVTQVIETLKIQLETEKLNSPSICQTLKWMEEKLNSENFQDLTNATWKVLKEIKPLDMELIGRLIEKTAAAIEQIQNQDIILLLGVTGAGKSTTIHFLAGSKMKKIMVKGMKHIAPETPLPELESFVTSPFTRSETKSINAVKIPILNGSIILCDTPGFGDTDGPEIDIINGIGLVNAVKTCRSVKPLILVNQDSIGARLEGVIKLSRTLIMLVSDIKNQLDKFSYVFTKYPKEEEDEIHWKLRNKLENLIPNDRANNGFVALLEDMIKKTTSGAKILDPLKDNPNEFLDSIVATPVITNPADIFRDFVTPESLDKLKEQIYKHQVSINIALHRFDTKLLNYKLNQLRILNLNLHIQDSEVTYLGCVREVTQFIQRLMIETFNRMDTCLLDGNTSITDDLNSCRSNILNLINFEDVRKDHLTELTSLISACAVKVQYFQLNLLERIKGQLIEDNLSDANIGLTIIHLDKMSLITEIFSNIFDRQEFSKPMVESYKEACQLLSGMFARCQTEATLLVKAHHFSKYACQVERMKFLIDHFCDHLDVKLCSQAYQEVKLAFIQYLQDKINLANTIFQQKELTSQNLADIGEITSLMIAAQATEGLQRHIDIKEIVSLQDLLLENSAAYCQQSRDAVVTLCKEKNQEFFISIKAHIVIMDELRAIPMIGYKNTKTYDEMIDQIKTFIDTLKYNATLMLTSLFGNNMETPDNSDEFFRCLKELKEGEYLAGHSPSLYNNEFKEVLTLLEEFSLKINKYISETDLNTDQYEQIEPVYLIIKKLFLLIEHKELIPTVAQITEQSVAIFTAKVIDLLGKIQAMFKYDENLLSLKNAIACLYACNHIHLEEIAYKVASIKVLAARFIAENFELVDERLSAAFNEVATIITTATMKELTGEKMEAEAGQNIQIISNCLQYVETFLNFYRSNSLLQKPAQHNIDLYQQLFRDVPTHLMDKWCHTENAYLPKLASQFLEGLPALESAANIECIYRKMSYARMLTNLDCFIIAGHKYDKIVSIFENSIRKINDNVITEVKLAVRSARYKEAAIAIKKLDLSNSDMRAALDEISKELSQALRKTNESLLVNVNGLKLTSTGYEVLKQLIDNLDDLRNATQYVIEYVDESTKTQFLCGVQNIETELHSKIRQFLLTSDSHIKKSEFHYAEQIFSAVRNISLYFKAADLTEYPSKNVFKNELISAVNEGKEKIQKKLAEAIQKYNPVNLEKLAESKIIELFNQLKLASNDDPVYGENERQLYKLIEHGIIELLNENKETSSLEDIEKRVALIESLTPYLPAELYASFDVSIKECKAQVNIIKEKHQRELAEDSAAGEINKMVQKLIKFAEGGHYWHMQELRTAIIKLITTGAIRFQTDIAKGDLIAVFDNLPKAWDDWVYYSTSLGNLAIPANPQVAARYKDLYADKQCYNLCVNIRNQIVTKLNEYLQEIERNIDNQANALTVIGTHFDKFISFLSLKNRASNFYRNMLGGDTSLEDNIKKLFPKLHNCFRVNQVQFEEKVRAENSLEELKKVMILIKESSALFIKAKDYSLSPLCSELTPQFKEVMQRLFSHSEMKSLLAREILRLKDIVLQIFLHHAKTKTLNPVDRDEFYKEVFIGYKQLKQAKFLVEHIEAIIADINLIEAECNEHISDQLTQISNAADKLLDIIPTSETNIYSDFNILYDNLRSFSNCFEGTSLAQIAGINMKNIDTKFDLKLGALREKASFEEDVKTLAYSLIVMKAIATSIPIYKPRIDETIDNLLLDIKKKSDVGSQRIGLLGLTLNDIDNATAQMIIAEHVSFKGYSLSLRNEKTLRFTVNDVLNTSTDAQGMPIGLNGDDLNINILREHYDLFDEEYWALVEKGLAGNIHEVSLQIIQDARMIADKPGDSKIIVRKLMAHVFAYWTLANSHHFTEALATGTESKNYLMQPHAAQVISIFRLFGIDTINIKAPVNINIEPTHDTKSRNLLGMLGRTIVSKTDKVVSAAKEYLYAEGNEKLDNTIILENHLVQIKTGEGKSVTLAITATVLALMGYDINCVCYSEYLSRRDYEAFQSIFNAFGLGKNVYYGTFNKMCEDFINENGDIRALVETMIKNGFTSIAPGSSGRRDKILLIDEVDVFFSKDFYGNLYKPLARLTDSSITALINYIWEIRDQPTELKIAKIKKTEQYLACCSKFRDWQFLIEESIKTMIADLKSYEKHDYVVIAGQIGYKDQDGISFTAAYGYKTLFAYYKERAAKNISQESLDARICLLVDCGSFSYAEIPKKYKCVMGVTGTLETLSKAEMNLLKEVYNIKKFSYTPSVYGPNQLHFSGSSSLDVIIESHSSYFMAIRNEINTRLVGSLIKRAVLVFFESTPKLMEFYRSPQLSDIKDRVKLITEEVSAIDKEALIRQAVTSNSITLLTREFGRGTDFICYDDKLIASGGVHVIQTFVSDELSEETQIKGRTARQGNKGSYSMVLLDQRLERFRIREEDIVKMKTSGERYSTIDQMRCKFFEDQYPENMRYVDNIRNDHVKSAAFLTSLISGNNMKQIQAFLLDRNKAMISDEHLIGSRTICLMDATGSMCGLIDGVKQTVGIMFDRAYKILQKTGIHSAFELQFAVYRNYDCPQETLLQFSTWETKPENLHTFIKSISAYGGTWWEEAIEVALQHVNQENEHEKVSQVILIGDAAPNKKNQVQEGRAKLKESYWTNTKFKTPTYYEDELRQLELKGIPVHAFYVNDSAKNSFKEIAKTTNGECEFLDINNPDVGAEILIRLVTERILQNVGGKSKGDSLVAAYRAEFCKGYVTAGNSSRAISAASQAAQPQFFQSSQRRTSDGDSPYQGEIPSSGLSR